MRTQVELLTLNRSGLYWQIVPPPPEEVAFKHRIDETYTAYPYYGYRRTVAQLHREGQQINQKRWPAKAKIAKSPAGLAEKSRMPDLNPL